jgi:hypothetical protein
LETFEQLKKVYFENLGEFHSWDGEKTWNHGGFNRTHLSYFISLAESIPDCEVIETGSGNSTIAFLLANPKKVDSVSPDFELWSRIEEYCKLYQISTGKLNPIKAKSEWALPSLALDKNTYDIGLIDGCHGWPTAFIDLYYIYFMLRKNGYLIIDDIQLHSIKEMANFVVSEVDKFELVVNLGKTLVFRKLTDELELGEWDQQRYIVERTNEARNFGSKFALYNNTDKNYQMLGYSNHFVTKSLIFVIRGCAWMLARIQGRFKG